MYVYDTSEGNREAGDDLAAKVADATVETVTVDDDQRRRSRFRTETDQGTEVGVVVGRELRAGDVLSASSGDGPLLEVALEPTDAVVVDFSDATGDADLITAVALGHATGNRHWDMAVRDDAVLFPATESAQRMDETIEPHLPEGATVRRESVSPAVFDGDGAGAGPEGRGHSHGHGDTHDHHSHDDHSHHHEDGQSHTHGHDDHAHDGPDGSGGGPG